MTIYDFRPGSTAEQFKTEIESVVSNTMTKTNVSLELHEAYPSTRDSESESALSAPRSKSVTKIEVVFHSNAGIAAVSNDSGSNTQEQQQQQQQQQQQPQQHPPQESPESATPNPPTHVHENPQLAASGARSLEPCKVGWAVFCFTLS